MGEALGLAMMVVSLLLLWIAAPRRGQERWLVRLQGMWVVLPLLIMLGFLGGGALVYESMVR